MFKYDAQEATPILQETLAYLSGASATSDDPDIMETQANLRNACGDLIANAERLLQQDAAGPFMDKCFDLAFQSGIQLPGIRATRAIVYTFSPQTIGGILTKNALIYLTLATGARIVSNTTFVSRDEVDYLKSLISPAYENAQENAADEMDQASYMALTQLRAALVGYLVDSARPLPRVLNYRFYDSLPTLVVGYKLYADALRGDEIRAENHIVHPLFALKEGRALSA